MQYLPINYTVILSPMCVILKIIGSGGCVSFGGLENGHHFEHLPFAYLPTYFWSHEH